MSKYSVCLLFALSSTTSVAQDSFRTAAVVLRDTEPAYQGKNILRDQAVLLDSHCNVLNTIDDLGLSQTVSYQSRALIDEKKQRLYVVENLKNAISCIDASGERIQEIKVESPGAIVLNNDRTRLACVVGESLPDFQTAVIDLESGKEVSRLPFGGVAFANDQHEELVWAVGDQIVAFKFDGEIRIRRPLSQLDPEDNHPTVINARNWAATGVAFMYNSNSWWRSFWILERDHPDVRGSKNRLFAVDEKGRIEILTELNDIDPMSIAIPPRKETHSVFVVDYESGDVLEFNSDGELRQRHALDAHLIAAGEKSGLWIANNKSIRRLDPQTLKVIAQHDFETEALPGGLAVR